MQTNALISAVGLHGKEDWTDLEAHLYVWGSTVPETSGTANGFHAAAENTTLQGFLSVLLVVSAEIKSEPETLWSETPQISQLITVYFSKFEVGGIWKLCKQVILFWQPIQNKYFYRQRSKGGLVYDGFMSYVSFSTLPSHCKNLKLSTEMFLDLSCVPEDHPHTVVSPPESQSAFWFTQWVRDSVQTVAGPEHNTCKLTRHSKYVLTSPAVAVKYWLLSAFSSVGILIWSLPSRETPIFTKLT